MRHETRAGGRDLPWLELAKAAALLWIVLDHVVERLAGGAWLGNPNPHWPDWSVRVAQFGWPAPGGAAVVALRDLGWLGDEGVGVFLVLSGLGIGWGLTRARAPFSARSFLTARAARIYPAWLTAHAAIGVPFALLGKVSLAVVLLSALGIRFLPATYYAIVPAWWYVGLLLQLYAFVPVLWWAQRRYGIGPVVGAAVVGGLAIRAAGWNVAGPFIDEWSRGAFFATRLPEFAAGFGLAVWSAANAERLRALLLRPSSVALAASAFVAGNLLALTWYGMIVAPLLMSAGAFALVGALFAGRRARPFEWIGAHSFALYLVHQFAIGVLVRPGAAGRVALEIAAALALTPCLAVGLEWATAGLTAAARTPRVRRAAVAAAIALVAAAYAGEAAVRAFDPQEADGWGERVALIPDPVVGWKLRPNTRTHLRWSSYDYVVTANRDGFPAPDPPRTTPSGTVRIMTVGNAYTSAEGVDTQDSWPRLLARSDPHLSVADFAISGHGPNQFAAVVHAYGPSLRPNIVVVQMWVKDFGDALVSVDDFRHDIGFDRPTATGPAGFARLTQLRAWLGLRVVEPLKARVLRRPDPDGYFLGGFGHFERARDAEIAAGYARTRDDLRRVRDDAARWGGTVAIAMFPASIQVCRPGDLPYYPRHVDFHDPARFDPDRPQRLARALAGELHLRYIDVREAFAAQPCVYATHNMHLTANGQQIVSAFLARRLAPAIAATPR